MGKGRSWQARIKARNVAFRPKILGSRNLILTDTECGEMTSRMIFPSHHSSISLSRPSVPVSFCMQFRILKIVTCISNVLLIWCTAFKNGDQLMLRKVSNNLTWLEQYIDVAKQPWSLLHFDILPSAFIRHLCSSIPAFHNLGISVCI